MGRDGVSDLGAIEDASEESRVFADGQVGAVRGLALQFRHHLAGLAAGGLVPKATIFDASGGGGETPGHVEMASDDPL